MKVALAILALAAAASTGPVHRAIDWAAVAGKAQELYALVEGTLDEIIVIAKEDNADVGEELEAALQPHIDTARGIFAEANTEIENETLTVESAEAIFARLQQLLAQVREELADFATELSPEVAAQITGLIENTYVEGESIAQEIYELLRA